MSSFSAQSVEISSKIDNLNMGLTAISQTIALVSKDMDHVRDDVKRQEQRLNETNFDIDQLRFENAHLEKEISNARKVLDSSLQTKTALEAEVNIEKVKVDELNGELDTYRNNVTALKMKASALSERFLSVEDKKNFLEEGIKTDKERLNTLFSEGQRSETRIQELDQEYADKENRC